MPSVSLQNDTGTAGDNITTDPTLTGSISADPGFLPVYVEFDFDGDGIEEDYVYTDTGGSFDYDPTGYISYGQVTINVSGAYYDQQAGSYVFSGWQAFTFTYEAPPNDPPAVASLSLQNDTGTAGDNITDRSHAGRHDHQ